MFPVGFPCEKLWKLYENTNNLHPAASTYKVPNHPKPPNQAPPPERTHSAMVKILEMPLLGQLWASMPCCLGLGFRKWLSWRFSLSISKGVGILRGSIPTWYIICILSHVKLKVCMFKTTTIFKPGRARQNSLLTRQQNPSSRQRLGCGLPALQLALQLKAIKKPVRSTLRKRVLPSLKLT